MGHNFKQCSADTLVRTGKGVLHTITLSCNDSAPTAGSITVYDNTSATGTVLFSCAITTTFFNPVTIILDALVSTGIYIDFTTTADVNVTVTYR